MNYKVIVDGKEIEYGHWLKNRAFQIRNGLLFMQKL